MKNKCLTGDLGDYRFEETEDGSQTLYSAYFEESCHSHSGAWEETLYNYVYGCDLPKRLSTKVLNIFEVGFATGLGLKATLDYTQGPLNFISSELDEKLALHFCQELAKEGYITDLKRFGPGLQARLRGREGQFTLLLGDIREGLPRWRQSSSFKKVHAIYQDAFSPKRNGMLWTYEWFAELKRICERDVILSTYSSTKAVWKALIANGFKVRAVPGYGKKRLSTRATLGGTHDPRVVEWCKKSPTPLFRDHDFNA